MNIFDPKIQTKKIKVLKRPWQSGTFPVWAEQTSFQYGQNRQVRDERQGRQIWHLNLTCDVFPENFPHLHCLHSLPCLHCIHHYPQDRPTSSAYQPGGELWIKGVGRLLSTNIDFSIFQRGSSSSWRLMFSNFELFSKRVCVCYD